MRLKSLCIFIYKPYISVVLFPHWNVFLNFPKKENTCLHDTIILIIPLARPGMCYRQTAFEMSRLFWAIFHVFKNYYTNDTTKRI